MLNASQKRMKRAPLMLASMSSTPASHAGWLPTMPTTRPPRRAKPTIDVARIAPLHLEEAAVVDDALDHLAHVVRLSLDGGTIESSARPARFGSSSVGRTAGPRRC
jgi:hypothetical protein